MNKFLKIAALSLALLLILAPTSEAGKPRFRYGVQWGYSALGASGCEYTIYNSVGSRVSDGKPFVPHYFTNAYFSADLGLEFARYFALTAKAGYRGIDRDYRVAPLELQLSLFPFGYERSGMFLFGSGGLALYDWSLADKINLLSGGMGYRHNLSRKISLDGIFRLNYINCSPLVVDDYEGVVPRDRTVYSRATHLTADVGIVLYF